MLVFKFGGTSLATPERMLNVCRLIQTHATDHTLGVVVSAIAGVTDELNEQLQSSRERTSLNVVHCCDVIKQHHLQFIYKLKVLSHQLDAALLIKQIEALAEEHRGLLTCLQEATCPKIESQLLALGERCSSLILHALLNAEGLVFELLNPQEYIKTEGPHHQSRPLYTQIYQAFSNYRAKRGEPHVLMPGFFGANQQGELTLLGRNGSDVSAALLASGLDAQQLVIWTDVDGVLSADPKLVEQTQLWPEMTYEQCKALCFYGAKVLHPTTIDTLIDLRIPTRIRNTFKPEHNGTLINANAKTQAKGVSLKQHCVCITIPQQGERDIDAWHESIRDKLHHHDVEPYFIFHNTDGMHVVVDEIEQNTVLNILWPYTQQPSPLKIHHQLSLITLVDHAMPNDKLNALSSQLSAPIIHHGFGELAKCYCWLVHAENDMVFLDKLHQHVIVTPQQSQAQPA